MCGIVAIFGYRAAAPKVSAPELSTIRDAMRPRGPDGKGLWLSADGCVGLAHRRLAIIDLSDAGAQPMRFDDDPLSHIITFNGEIYNYRELRATLEAQGCNFRSTSDTEVLLHLYRRDGAAMVERLRGMYAFVIWDARQRRLLAARDPFGIKPLYCADDGQTIRLASQVKALLAGGRIDTTPEPAGHAGFFLFGHVPEPFTLYKGIRSLPAGSVLTIEDGGPLSERQAIDIVDTLAAVEANAGAVPTDDAEIAAALADSARSHPVAGVDVGAFLSAGKDSTTFVALAARALSVRSAGWRHGRTWGLLHPDRGGILPSASGTQLCQPDRVRGDYAQAHLFSAARSTCRGSTPTCSIPTSRARASNAWPCSIGCAPSMAGFNRQVGLIGWKHFGSCAPQLVGQACRTSLLRLEVYELAQLH